MKIGRILLTALILISFFCGCTKNEIAPIYPNYSPEKEVNNVVMTAERISEHRYRLFIENTSDELLYVDSTFALYTEDGKPVPLARDLLRASEVDESESFAEQHPLRKMTYTSTFPLSQPSNYSYTRSYGVTLSLLYGKLKPGNYRIVKQLVDGYYDNETTPLDQYISAPITITETMSDCDYEAAFLEYPDMLWAGTSIEDLKATASNATPVGLTLTIEHIGDTVWCPNTVNGRFVIFEDVEGEWLPVRPKIIPTAWGLVGSSEITADAPFTTELLWEQRYGRLSPGTYLLAVECYRHEGNMQIQDLVTAEFEVPKE